MTQEEYNRYTWMLVDECDIAEDTMPQLCGGYTYADWRIICGDMINIDCVAFMEQNEQCDMWEIIDYVNDMTKPYWA